MNVLMDIHVFLGYTWFFVEINCTNDSPNECLSLANLPKAAGTIIVFRFSAINTKANQKLE